MDRGPGSKVELGATQNPNPPAYAAYAVREINQPILHPPTLSLTTAFNWSDSMILNTFILNDKKHF